jgi:hypothetical protein
MNEPLPPPADQVPTLTEVVGLSTAAAAPAFDEAGLVDEVLHSLQQRIDLMFEYRLREALAPMLAQMAEALIEDAKVHMASTLREVVARAVAQEVAKRQRR